MTKFDKNWLAAEEAKRQWMAENGLYREEYERRLVGYGCLNRWKAAVRLLKTGSRR